MAAQMLSLVLECAFLKPRIVRRWVSYAPGVEPGFARTSSIAASQRFHISGSAVPALGV